MKVFWSIVVALAIAAIAVAAYVWSGAYNVAATVPHWGITSWFLETVRERSIEAHSGGISVPPLDDPELVNSGLPHFHETCRLCHGAPGISAHEFARGLYPVPPSLNAEEVQELSDAELLWVVKYGLKMSGMPAFGPTHGDKEILGIISFVRRLPDLNPEEYKTMLQAAGLLEEEVLHHHEPAEPEEASGGHGEDEH